MTQILDGKATAAKIILNVKKHSALLLKEYGIIPGIAVIIVGANPASQVYVNSKEKMAKECGFHSLKYTLPETTTQQELLSLIEQLNDDDTVNGILVQLPLPKQIEENLIIQAILPEKDVDGFHYINIGRLSTGALNQALIPCTPAGSMLLIKQALGEDLSGKNAVIIGRSNIVGKPIAQLLLAHHATVTIAHSRSKNLPEICANADILIAAVGRPHMVKRNWIKPGATVIDVGINRLPEGNLVGDVDFKEVKETAGAITPVPGGVGPMTIAMLMTNTLIATCRKYNQPVPSIT